MNELTFNYKDEAFTDSIILAKGAGVEHRAVIQLITTYLDDVSEFGRVTFQMLPFETKGGVQKMKICRLNKEQATFIISLMKMMDNKRYRICRKCKEVWNVSCKIKGDKQYTCPKCEYGNKWVKRFCMRCYYGKET